MRINPKRISRIFSPTLIVIVAALFSSCGNKSFYEAEQTFNDGVWDADEHARFQPEINQANGDYFVFFDINSSKDFKTSNLWLFLKVSSPSGSVQTDTIEYDMADETGKWVGTIHGDYVETKLLYKADIRFPESGTYTFDIQQGMRDNQSPLISAFKLRIEKSE